MRRLGPPAADEGDDGPKSGIRRWVLLAGLLIVTAGLLALGAWQVERLAWKHELIARVEARVAAGPVPAPGEDRWSQIKASDDEYMRVRLDGTFLHDKEALVAASTERGPGFWVMTPLVQADGTTVIVNRGFVPTERRDRASRSGEIAGPVTVVGLLRLSEAGVWILRQNDAAADRWYRRDPLQIASARGLDRVAPYFVDAEASANTGEWPAGGMTRVQFSDNHLIYALTWFALAALTAFASAYVVRSEFGSARKH